MTVDLRNRTCVCVGAGHVAARRIPSLIAAGGRVRLIAPDVHGDLNGLIASGAITYDSRTYQPGDVTGAFLVLAVTGDSETDRAVAVEALAVNALICVAGSPELGNCRFMATIRRGSLLVALQTGGAAPAVSAALREYLEGLLPPRVGFTIDALADLREEARASISSATERTKRWQAAVADGDVLAALSGEGGALKRIRSTLLAPEEDPSPAQL